MIGYTSRVYSTLIVSLCSIVILHYVESWELFLDGGLVLGAFSCNLMLLVLEKIIHFAC